MRVIITGAAGVIGSQIIEELAGSHELCLIDRIPVPGHTSIVADLARTRLWTRWRPWTGFQPPKWTTAFENAQVVLHLANDLEHLGKEKKGLFKYIQMTWNVFEAAVYYQVPRVVFASSNWVVKALEQELAPACYRPDGPKIGSEVPPRPINGYGLSKAFGETAGRSLVDEGQLTSFVAMRIGAYGEVPPKGQACTRWIGIQDIRSLMRCCVEREFEGFQVIYGVSAQPESPFDLSHTSCLLSWSPKQFLSETQLVL